LALHWPRGLNRVYTTPMDAIVRQVRDLDTTERSAIERLVGHALAEDQKLVIQVLNGAPSAAKGEIFADQLPNWCRVYEGLSDQQIVELEEIVLKRADLTRSS